MAAPDTVALFKTETQRIFLPRRLKRTDSQTGDLYGRYARVLQVVDAQPDALVADVHPWPADDAADLCSRLMAEGALKERGDVLAEQTPNQTHG